MDRMTHCNEASRSDFAERDTSNQSAQPGHRRQGGTAAAAAVLVLSVVLALAGLVVLATASRDTVAVGHASPAQRTVKIYAQADNSFDPKEFHADLGEPLKIIFTNTDYFGRHNLVFELDGGRVISTDVIGFPYERTLTFDAPASDGVYWYYSSVGNDRANGYEGKLFAGNAKPTEEATVSATPGEEPTAATTATATAHATETAEPTATATPTETPAPPPDIFLPANLKGAPIGDEP